MWTVTIQLLSKALQFCPPLSLILTCDKEVGEDQEAAAAETDRTVGAGQRGQEDKIANQFGCTQRGCSLQHATHGWNKTTHAHGSASWKPVLLLVGRVAQGWQVLQWQQSF